MQNPVLVIEDLIRSRTPGLSSDMIDASKFTSAYTARSLWKTDTVIQSGGI